MKQNRIFKKIITNSETPQTNRNFLYGKQNTLTVETNIFSSENPGTTNVKASFVDPNSMLIQNKTMDLSNNLKERIKEAKSYFKIYINKKNIPQPSNDNTNANQSLNSKSFKEDVDIYSFLKEQEKRLFKNKKTNPFQLFKRKIIIKNIKGFADEKKKPTSASKYASEKKTLEKYLINPETKLPIQTSKSSPLKKPLTSMENRLYYLTNPRRNDDSHIQSTFYSKISEVRSKFDLHRSYNWESLAPINNEFLNKKELGLGNFFENAKKVKYEHLKIPTQNAIPNKTPKMSRLKSYLTPRMSIAKSNGRKPKETFLSGEEKIQRKESILEESKEKLLKKESLLLDSKLILEEMPEKRNLNALFNNLLKDGEKTQECERSERKATNLVKKCCYENLAEDHEHENIQEYREFLKTPKLTEEEIEFLVFVKKGDLLNVKEMLRKNKTLIKIKDQHQLTPLHWAAKRGHEKIIEVLLEYGAKADQTDILGRIPKDLCLLYGHMKSMKKLNFSRKTVIIANPNPN